MSSLGLLTGTMSKSCEHGLLHGTAKSLSSAQLLHLIEGEGRTSLLFPLLEVRVASLKEEFRRNLIESLIFGEFSESLRDVSDFIW